MAPNFLRRPCNLLLSAIFIVRSSVCKLGYVSKTADGVIHEFCIGVEYH